MKRNLLERLPTVAAVVVVVLVVAACAVRLRDDENQAATATPADESSDPLATKLAECRTVTYEQKDTLSECRKAWTEKRRQFLGQGTSSMRSDSGASRQGSPLFVPKDQVPPGFSPIPHSEKE